MQTGELVSILGRGRRHGFRRWGTAIVVDGGDDMVRVRFDEGDPFDAYLWNERNAALEPPASRSLLFARSLPASPVVAGDASSRA